MKHEPNAGMAVAVIAWCSATSTAASTTASTAITSTSATLA